MAPYNHQPSYAQIMILVQVCLMLALLFGACSATSLSLGDESSTLVAFYMVGSNLESGYGLATDDITEICQGMSGSTGSVDVVVAYGGSRKPGWSGMTIATSDDLAADLKNGIIGDEALYQKHIPDANMGDASALSAYLDYIKALPSHSRNILIFWDHGDSNAGLCLDENYGDDLLSLDEVNNSLKTSGLYWDLIGMDACYMGSYEVAGAVAGFGDLLLVSEEIIPGDGWDYATSLQYLVKNQKTTMEEFGKAIIDSYLVHPSENQSLKTLSLLNLTRFSEIQQEIGALGRNLSDTLEQGGTYSGIGSSWYLSHNFGYDLQTDTEKTVDLLDFSTILSQDVPDSAEQIRRLEHAIVNAIIYQRQDGSSPGINGLSMYSPRNKPLSEVLESVNISSVNPDWKEFLTDYLTHVNTDLSIPVITDLGGGRYRITDDKGVQSVYVETSWHNDLNVSHIYELKAEPVYPDADGVYTPNPDDKTFYIQDRNTGNQEILYHEYLGKEAGRELYRGSVLLTRGTKTREGLLLFAVQESGNIEYNLIKLTRLRNGKVLFSKEPMDLRAGDQITPLIKEDIFDEQETITSFIPLNPVNLTGDMVIVRDRLPYGAYYPFLRVKDYNGNQALMDIGKLRFPNTATIIP